MALVNTNLSISFIPTIFGINNVEPAQRKLIVISRRYYFVGEGRSRVDVVELLDEDRDEQDDDTQQYREPEVRGVHAVEGDALVRGAE